VIQHVAAGEHHCFENDWLTARWQLSFGDHAGPRNVTFGPLRVFNEERVRPARGFDPQHHSDTEIVTCVLSGTLAHEDDRGHQGTLGAGDVQVLSTGSGIVHSERNPSSTEVLHMVQAWLAPWRRGGDPRYLTKHFPADAVRGKLHPVVSRESKIAGTLPIHQDAFIHLGDLGPGESVTHDLRQARGAYVFLAAGSGLVNGLPVAAGDAVRIRHESAVVLSGLAEGRFLLIDLV
jgi:redox-sensitive bicupin YhaK (pirin superfamily)